MLRLTGEKVLSGDDELYAGKKMFDEVSLSLERLEK
jgi:hypothetical protein